MSATIHNGDWVEQLRMLPDQSVHMVCTSPPYWGLRDYGVDGQLGLERTPAEYVTKVVEGFREVWRVLRDDGTCWVNLGDCYNGTFAREPNIRENGDFSFRAGGRATKISGLKPKDLVGIPWHVAFALQADGWYLRMDVIWNKKNPMPESVQDRPTKAHEYIFLLSKSERYFYDAHAIKEEVSGTAHSRGDGVNPKAKTPGNNSRIHQDRDPNHSQARKVKQNESFSGSVNELVAFRNKRSVWEVATAPFAEAHFATFPPKLIEPCILAGTSERGCCPQCGAQWERVIESDRSFESGSGRAGNVPEGKLAGGTQVREDHDIRMGPTITAITIGWEPGCTCAAGDPIPCTVLDPFNGAGTTGLVARRFGRHYIGIELNPDYVEMAAERIIGDAPLFNTVEKHTTVDMADRRIETPLLEAGEGN